MFGSATGSTVDRASIQLLLARLAVGLVLGITLVSGCTGLRGASGPEAKPWPALAKTWFNRAASSFESLDSQDAEIAIANARRLAPARPEIRLLAARIALSQVRYDEALQALSGLRSREARSLEARALWRSGQLERAGAVVERLLDDAEHPDPWASEVVELTRTGSGRDPFHVTGGQLAVVNLLQVPQPTFVVPVELNGEEVLAMVATGSSEVVVHGTDGRPSWVSLRFARRLEVKDVPAFSRDLSALSSRVGAPIRMLLGVSLLRRLHVTFDFHGGQFVVRNFDPSPAPGVERLPVSYLLDGRMAMRSRLSTREHAKSAGLLLDTEQLVTLSLGRTGWAKANENVDQLSEVPGEPSLRQGKVEQLTLGSFDIPGVPGVYGLPVPAGDGSIAIDGLIGSSLLAEFRVSLVDQGRGLWLEAMPMAVRPLE